MCDICSGNIHGFARWSCTLIVSAIFVACTHVSEPGLTVVERATALKQLEQWPEGEIISIFSGDGARLMARLYRPHGKIVATIVAMHGLETHSKWFALLATELNKRGIALIAMDRRGSGLNRGIGGNGQLDGNQSYHMWLQDVLANVRDARRYGARVYVMGNSWGGNPILAWSEEKDAPTYANGVVLLTPGLASYKPNRLQQLEILFARDSKLLGTCLSVKDYSRRRSTWALLEEDGLLTKEVSARFFRQTRIMRMKALQKLGSEKLPILLICADRDELMKNGEMRHMLESKLPAKLYSDCILDNDFHLALIEDPQRVAARIAVWIEMH